MATEEYRCANCDEVATHWTSGCGCCSDATCATCLVKEQAYSFTAQDRELYERLAVVVEKVVAEFRAKKAAE